ncbi:MAG: hypothetical protein ACOCVR_04705 [Myxococcota bacterium]
MLEAGLAEPEGLSRVGAALQEAVGLVPLAELPAHAWKREDLDLARSGEPMEIDPAWLWRWPDGLPLDTLRRGTQR